MNPARWWRIKHRNELAVAHNAKKLLRLHRSAHDRRGVGWCHVTEFPSQRDYSNNLIFSNIRTPPISCSTCIMEAQLFFSLLPNKKNGQKKKNAARAGWGNTNGVKTVASSEPFLISNFLPSVRKQEVLHEELSWSQCICHMHFIIGIFLWSLLCSLVRKYVTSSCSNPICPSILPLLKLPQLFCLSSGTAPPCHFTAKYFRFWNPLLNP